jgi:hypothetical protein
MTGAVYICGGDTHPGPRDACPDALHDYPLPTGYIEASDEASRRLSRRWSNRRCGRCGLYGWAPGARDIDAPRTPANRDYGASS